MTLLKLTINGLVIDLSMSLDPNKLKSHGIKKLGLLGRLTIKKEPEQTVYWSKNCDICCLDDKFILTPILDIKSGHDIMYGTSAYLYFKNDSLAKVTFQLVGNAIAANWITDEFQKHVTEEFGDPQNIGEKIIWNDGQNHIVAEKLSDSQQAYFHYLTN